MKLVIRKSNEDIVVVLPQDVLARLGWASGDALAAEIVGDGLKLLRVETDFDRTMRIARECMDEYSGTLEQLAKS